MYRILCVLSNYRFITYVQDVYFNHVVSYAEEYTCQIVSGMVTIAICGSEKVVDIYYSVVL